MRQGFLTVRGETFDPQTMKVDIERIAQLFGEYLYGISRGGSRSKYRALGAVGKALQRARGGVRGDALLGYSRRVHEQTTKSTFPAGGVERLDDGIRALNALLERADIPARERSEVISQIDYATYYDVKRRNVEDLKQTKQRWDAFVRDNAQRLRLDATDVADLAWFSKEKIKSKSAAWARAVDEFATQPRVEIVAEPIDEEEEDR
jgi:hypothetical protein